MIQRNVVSVMVTKDDLKTFATRDDLKAMEKRTNDRFDEMRMEMATKSDILELERKLIEDTDAMTGVEQKHYRSHAQRIAHLEKEVFPKGA